MAQRINLIPGQHIDLDIYQGTTVELPLQFLDASGNPIDLTTVDIRIRFKVRASDANTVIPDITKGNGITVSGTEAMVRRWGELPGGKFVFEIKLTFSDGDVSYPWYGTAEVKRNLG